MDFALEETFDIKFSTWDSTGAPITFAGSPAVEIYEDNSTTQITGAETLTVDFDSITGLHNLRIAATAANGFESGKSYAAVVSAGTVDSISQVGAVIANFSIEKSAARDNQPSNFSVLGIESDGDLTKVNTLDGHTAQTQDHTAAIADIPTNTEFEARTLLASSYFDPANDTVANVTTVATVTNGVTVSTNNDKTGYSLSQAFPSNFADMNLTASGNIGIDWANVENPNSSVSLGATTVSNTSFIASVEPPANWADMAIDASGHVEANVVEWNNSAVSALNDVSTTQVRTQVDNALSDIHLDHLLAAAYTPGSKPGDASSLWNSLLDSSGDFTVSALQNAPSGGGGGGSNDTTLLSTTVDTVTSQTEFILTAGSPDDDVYNDAMYIIEDSATSNQKDFGLVSDYAGSTNTITIPTAPAFTIAAGDTFKVIANATASTEFTGTVDANIVSTELTPSEILTGIEGDKITQVRGDNWSIAVLGLGDLTGYQKIWFTVKKNFGKTDAQSMIQIEESVGLVYIDGSIAGSPGNGSITVDSVGAGNITVAASAVETAKLDYNDNCVYDIQWKNTSGAIQTLASGVFKLSGDVTRASS